MSTITLILKFLPFIAANYEDIQTVLKTADAASRLLQKAKEAGMLEEAA